MANVNMFCLLYQHFQWGSVHRKANGKTQSSLPLKPHRQLHGVTIPQKVPLFAVLWP